MELFAGFIGYTFVAGLPIFGIAAIIAAIALGYQAHVGMEVLVSHWTLMQNAEFAAWIGVEWGILMLAWLWSLGYFKPVYLRIMYARFPMAVVQSSLLVIATILLLEWGAGAWLITWYCDVTLAIGGWVGALLIVAQIFLDE
jgi:hypothetical protein